MTSPSIVNRDSPLPLYAQVKRKLQAEIMAWPMSNDRFYTDQDLQGIFGVSRATVRQALTELEGEGLVHRRQGYGTFVNRNKIEESFSTRHDFSSQWAQSGRTLRVENLTVSRRPCPAQFARMLGVELHTEVVSMERIRLSGDMRIAWDLWLRRSVRLRRILIRIFPCCPQRMVAHVPSWRKCVMMKSLMVLLLQSSAQLSCQRRSGWA